MSRRLARRLALAVAALGLVVVPSSSGGGFPGRNGRIVAVAGGTVYAISSSGTKTTLATGANATNDGASLSPDGTKVVYTSSTGKIHVHCLDGSCDTDLATGTEPAWSPDGTKIAYVSSAGHIHMMSATNGSGDVDLTPSASSDNHPAWSPDGTTIAFDSNQSGHSEIWTVPSAGGSQTQVTSTSGTEQDLQPTWSPDGQTIAFQSDRVTAGTYQIYTVPASGGSVTEVTSDSSSDTAPVYSPEGDEIAFSQGDNVDEVSPSGGTATVVATLTAAPETSDWEVLVPTNTAAPTISSVTNPIPGNTVTVDPGTWDGVDSSLSNDYEYQFLRCATDGSGCTAIGSFSTSSSYTLTGADAGYTIAAYVIGANDAGQSAQVATSNHTPTVLGSGPTNTSPPTVVLGSIGGVALTQPQVGSYLSATIGSWTGNGNTYAYQWKKCDPKTTSCFTIAGATTSYYIPTADVYGWQLRVEVDATNSAGVTAAQSDPTQVVTAQAPVNTVSPQITGQNQVGSTLFVNTGVWTGTPPLAYTYQWKRCDPQGDLTSCVAIPGATTFSYVQTSADVGSAIRAFVTATNVTGPVSAFTNHTFPTLPAPTPPAPPKPNPQPANTTAPTIGGTPTVGAQLTGDRGAWTGQAPLRYSYLWERCSAVGSLCKAVPGARGADYTVRSSDVGSTLRLAVTARNKVGAATAVSSVTGTIALGKPVPKGRRLVGTNGNDYLAGGGGNDVIIGRGGNDTILGGAGNDLLEGGPGNDVIDGGTGHDRIYGGPGNDTILASEGDHDYIDCGPGLDHAVVNSTDKVVNCEVVTIVANPATTTSPATTTPPGG